MAKRKRQKSTQSKSQDPRRQPQSEKSSNLYPKIGIVVLIVAVLGFGAFQFLGAGGPSQTAPASAAALSGSGDLETISLEEGQNLEPAHVEPISDRETRYLGPPSDPGTLVKAEAGELDHPTLVWFHADWCHICQQIEPEVIDLGEEYDGQVNFVRLNVDHAESRAAVQRYGVRGTPMFVLFDADGQIRGNVPGWPGGQAMTGAFDQLLAEKG